MPAKPTSQQSIPTTDFRPRRLRVAEAADYLALSKFALRERARAGHIPYCIEGHTWVFNREDLDNYADRTRGTVIQ